MSFPSISEGKAASRREFGAGAALALAKIRAEVLATAGSAGVVQRRTRWAVKPKSRWLACMGFLPGNSF